MNKIMVLLLIVAMAGLSHAGIVNGDSVSVDFNTAGDVGDFIVLRDDSASVDSPGLDIAQNPVLGVGGTGGVEPVNVSTVNGSNDLASLYAPGGTAANGAISLGVGETLTLSMKFKVLDYTSAATPRLGVGSFSEGAAASANWTATDYNGAKDFIGGGNGAHADGIATNLVGASGDNVKFSIVDVQYDPVKSTTKTFHETAGADTLFEVVNGNWYQFELGIIKSATTGDFDITSTLNDLGTDGTALVGMLYTMGTTITNPDLYDDDMLAGFTFVANGAPTSISTEYDDFTVSVVPEPATMALLGLGMVMLRRKK